MRIAQAASAAASLAAVALGVLLALPARAGAPSVVVSVAPVHALVAGVMAGIGAPRLLVQGGRSPHTAALRPSDIRRLRDADVIVWVGPGLESFMARPVAALDRNRRTAVLTLYDAPGVRRLALRAGGAWQAHDEHHDHAPADEHGRSPFTLDAHLWLSPDNAAAIARAAASLLADRDPANAAAYAANARRLQQRIAALEARLAAMLAPVRRTPYLVFHDAYQYFERHFGLKPVGAVTLGPERQIGARRLSGLRDHMAKTGARCAFREPQFPPSLIETIVEGTGIRIGVLDPLGAGIPPGPDHWFTLMDNLAKSLVRCLRAAN